VSKQARFRRKGQPRRQNRGKRLPVLSRSHDSHRAAGRRRAKVKMTLASAGLGNAQEGYLLLNQPPAACLGQPSDRFSGSPTFELSSISDEIVKARA